MNEPCPCECNNGGFCGGCGHRGCGRRRGRNGELFGVTLSEKRELRKKLKEAVRVENWTDVMYYASLLDSATIIVHVEVQQW